MSSWWMHYNYDYHDQEFRSEELIKGRIQDFLITVIKMNLIDLKAIRSIEEDQGDASGVF